MHKLAQLDHRYVWHPFTQMRDWLRQEPITIVSGKGTVLRDVHGREYLDANASIWTNLHGHGHPTINAAIRRQLNKVAHSSALGLANEPASLLAQRLVDAARLPAVTNGAKNAKQREHEFRIQPESEIRQPELAKVFFSDDGSTAMEVALKLAYEFARRTGRSRRPRFLSLHGAYHGDTVGAVSLGHIDLFHAAYRSLLFRSDAVMAPYCYRCPFNRARPERADAREYRRCRGECVDKVEQRLATQRRKSESYAGVVIEPLIQGAAGMIAQPSGWLRQVAALVRAHGALLIADEILTGFGRTGAGGSGETSLFASHHEGVQPDLMALAKGLSGGYLPLGATLTSQALFDVFLGDYAEFKTFFHGHSFTANQLGCAAALANLDLLDQPTSRRRRLTLEQMLRSLLPTLWGLPNVGDIRQVGLIAGIELVKNWRTREPFDLRDQAGIRVCQAMARRGVLTRPIGNVVVILPPYCTTPAQLGKMVVALRAGIGDVFGRHASGKWTRTTST